MWIVSETLIEIKIFTPPLSVSTDEAFEKDVFESNSLERFLESSSRATFLRCIQISEKCGVFAFRTAFFNFGFKKLPDYCEREGFGLGLMGLVEYTSDTLVIAIHGKWGVGVMRTGQEYNDLPSDVVPVPDKSRGLSQ